MNDGTNPALTAGENRDGSMSLAKESRVGALVTFLLTTGATAALGYAGQLDLSTLPGWATGAATYAVAHVVGLLAAYVKANR